MEEIKSILLADIYFDKDYYPRKEVNKKKVDEYVEALKSGKEFPPVKLQKVLYSEEGKPSVERIIIIDGAHRTTAYRQYNKWFSSEKHSEEDLLELAKPIENVPYILHSDKVYSDDNPQEKAELLLVAAKFNSEHGYQMTPDEKKEVARAVYKLNPNQSQKEIGNALGTSQPTISEWILDLKQQHEASREAIIIKLNLLGWSQEEIGEVVELTHQAVSEILQKISKSLKLAQSLKGLIDMGKSIDEASNSLGLDPALAWALLLQGEEDIKKLKKLEDKNKDLKCSPRPYDLWNFGSSFKLFGTEGYPGQIPGQIILQLLYFFTKQGDLVVDPMAGGGTTVDACLVMGRKCFAFDSEPETCKARIDIREKDAIKAIEELTRKPQMIFLDPPYYKKMDKDYGENSISRKDRESYLDSFSKIAQVARAKLEKGGRVALLMSDYNEYPDTMKTEDEQKKENKRALGEDIFIHQYITRFEKEGFRVERIIFCPLSMDQIHPDTINKFRDSRKLGRLTRYLVIFNAA